MDTKKKPAAKKNPATLGIKRSFSIGEPPVSQNEGGLKSLTDIVSDNRLTEQVAIPGVVNNENTDSQEASLEVTPTSILEKTASAKEIKPETKQGGGEVKGFEDFFKTSMTMGDKTKNIPIAAGTLNTFKILANQHGCTMLSLVNNILEDWKSNHSKEINKTIKNSLL